MLLLNTVTHNTTCMSLNNNNLICKILRPSIRGDCTQDAVLFPGGDVNTASRWLTASLPRDEEEPVCSPGFHPLAQRHVTRTVQRTRGCARLSYC